MRCWVTGSRGVEEEEERQRECAKGQEGEEEMARYELKEGSRGWNKKSPVQEPERKGEGQRSQALLPILERDDFFCRARRSLRNALNGVGMDGSVTWSLWCQSGKWMEEGNSEQGELHQEGNSSPSKRKQYLRLAGGHGDGKPGRIQGIAGKK